MLQRHYSAAAKDRGAPLLEKATEEAFNLLELDEWENPKMRWQQLVGMANTISRTWGRDTDFDGMITETVIEAPVPWDGEFKTYYCIPDAFALVNKGRTGVILSHKTRLSSLPMTHILTHYHQQLRLEAWALKEVYGVRTVELYLNALTPKQAQREGPFLYTDREHEFTTVELRRMFEQVGKEKWVARPGPHCFGCDYKNLHDIMAEGGNLVEAKEEYRDEYRG
tara:strand:+ start:1803 stop:2474 length:672 start_codon:yes stop_codon:yes gene_type:complete